MGGGSAPDTSKQDALLAKQQALADKKEAELARELLHRRKAAAGAAAGRSATLFSQVEGTDSSIAKKTKLGG